MPVRPTFPGVYIEEIASGFRPVTAVATSTAALIGAFQRGLLNEAVQLFSMADFDREYGGLERDSEASYAVQQFFLNGGTEAWVVRVANDGSLGGGAVAASEAVIRLNEMGAPTGLLNIHAGRRIRGGSATNPGAWGNFLRIAVDHNGVAAGSTFNLTISEVRVDGNRTTVVQVENFSNLTMTPNTANNAIQAVNQVSRLVQLDRVGLPALPVPPLAMPLPEPSGTIGGNLAGALPTLAQIDNLTVTLSLGSPPAPATGFPLTLTSLTTLAAAPASFSEWTRVLQAAIRTAGSSLTIAPNLRAYLAGATVTIIGDGSVGNERRFVVRAGAGAQPYDPGAQLSFGGADAVVYGLSAPVSTGPQEFMPILGGADAGQDGTVLDASGVFVVPPSVFLGSPVAKTGLFALDDVDLFNVLAIPDAPRLGGANALALYTDAIAYVESRRAMLIVDIPEDVIEIDQMQTWMGENDGLRDPNSVVYYPRTFTPDPLNQNRARSLAPSGTIAGLWARTDSQRGVWKAPAGTDAQLRNVASLTRLMTDQENGVLNPLGVNCLRSFPVYSNICWGARTLKGADILASDWKYVPVRRTTLFLEESLYRGTKWAVFEPNDEPLWAQIRLNVGAFMQDLFRKGAFQGSTPKEAFFVKCDGDTTTQIDIDNGIVNIEVGFAPLKPAEFVILKIQQIVRSADA
jgi:uncharacterized protein